MHSTAYTGLGGNLKVSSGNTVAGRFSFSVITSEIKNIEKGNKYPEWVFKASVSRLNRSSDRAKNMEEAFLFLSLQKGVATINEKIKK